MASSVSSSTLPDRDKDEPVAVNPKDEHHGSEMEHNTTYDSITRTQSRPTDVEKVHHEQAVTSEDPNLVSWDGPDDPANPINFSSSLKLLNIGLVSAICFVTPLASSMFAPGVPELMAEFRSRSTELGSFVVSVYVLGFAVGPLMFAPLSELYGRVPIYHVCNVCFLAFTIACAVATDLNMMIVFRFFAGVFGSAPLTNGKHLVILLNLCY